MLDMIEIQKCHHRVEESFQNTAVEGDPSIHPCPDDPSNSKENNKIKENIRSPISQ
jgi:hypothetical protein